MFFKKKSAAPKVAAKPDQPDELDRGAAKRPRSVSSLAYLKGLHRQMSGEAFQRILSNPFASFLNCLMIAVSFALPALMYLLIVNLHVLGNGWEGQPRVSLYLESGLSQRQINQLRVEARDDQDIAAFVYITPETGLKDFQEKAQLQGVFEALGYNPLPGILELEPRDSLPVEELDGLVMRYQSLPGVMEVRLDREWVEKLASITDLIDRFALLLSGLLAVTVLLTIGNTVRLSVESRRSEIKVVKLVGGTDGFITLPFLYMGMWYGVGGALLSLIIVWAVLAGVMSGVLELAGLYGSAFQPEGPDFTLTVSLFAAGIVLGVLGAAVSCSRHLRDIEQTS